MKHYFCRTNDFPTAKMGCYYPGDYQLKPGLTVRLAHDINPNLWPLKQNKKAVITNTIFEDTRSNSTEVVPAEDYELIGTKEQLEMIERSKKKGKEKIQKKKLEFEEAINEYSAMRFNTGKLKWSLVHFKSLEPMIKVLEKGAEKYSPFNWQRPMDKKEILESAMRHLTALIDGEEFDPETGELHIGHLMCNAMFWTYHYNRENEL